MAATVACLRFLFFFAEMADFTMSLGGINYTAAPFNGWFMNTEVSARAGRELRGGKLRAMLNAFISYSVRQIIFANRYAPQLVFAVAAGIVFCTVPPCGMRHSVRIWFCMLQITKRILLFG